VTRRRVAGKEPTEPFAFIPFGAGPRICLGAQLAMAECVLAVALILHRYDLVPVDVAEEFPASAPGLGRDQRLLVRIARRRDDPWPA
jgi:cytochrome P450